MLVSTTSGLIKNDDRKGRKLQAAYRPINFTSAAAIPATVSFPSRSSRLVLPPVPSRLVFKHRRCKTYVIIVGKFQLNFPLTTIYDRINRLPGGQTPL